MDISKIKRPEVLEIPEGVSTYEIFAPKNIVDRTTNELVDIFIAPTLIISKNYDADSGDDNSTSHYSALFNTGIYKKFNDLTYRIGKLVRLAELNFDYLKYVISRYINKHPVAEIIDRNADCRALQKHDIEHKLDNLSIGILRSILSCIIKTDTQLHQIHGLENAASRKGFTKLYQHYIEDRDKYTHGILFFLYPDFAPALRVNSSTKGMHYVTCTKEVLNHNLMTYNYINSILREIEKTVQ